MRFRLIEKKMHLYILKQAFTIEPDYEQARYIYDMIQLERRVKEAVM